MRSLMLIGFLLLTAGANAASTANVDKSGLILSGYDAVSYFKGKEPVKGDAKFQTKVGDITYYFANEVNLNEFKKDPAKYTPAYEGWCAYAVAAKNDKVEIDPKSYVIQDGRLLLFYNGLFGDTKDKWLNTKGKTKEDYLKEADAHWPKVRLQDP